MSGKKRIELVTRTLQKENEKKKWITTSAHWP